MCGVEEEEEEKGVLSFVRSCQSRHTHTVCGKEENGVDMTLILWWKTNQRMTKAATDRVD